MLFMTSIWQRRMLMTSRSPLTAAMAVKVIELVGVSPKGYEDAISQAVERTARTVKNITGADVIGQPAKASDGKAVEYRANIKIAFVVK